MTKKECEIEDREECDPINCTNLTCGGPRLTNKRGIGRKGYHIGRRRDGTMVVSYLGDIDQMAYLRTNGVSTFWDIYPDDFQTFENAVKALALAPAPSTMLGELGIIEGKF